MLAYRITFTMRNLLQGIDFFRHMTRTNLRGKVELPELSKLQKFHSQVATHSVKHICIWQRIGKLVKRELSDQSGTFSISLSKLSPSIVFDGNKQPSSSWQF